MPILPSWYALERFSIFMAMDIGVVLQCSGGDKDHGSKSPTTETEVFNFYCDGHWCCFTVFGGTPTTETKPSCPNLQITN